MTTYQIIKSDPDKINIALLKVSQNGGKPVLMTTQLVPGTGVEVYIVIEYSQEK
jgi:hypothetical protein